MPMKRFAKHPVLSALLLAVWLLAHNSVAPGDVLLGLVLALAIPAVTAPFWPDAPVVRRYAPIPRLLAVVGWDILASNLRVAALVLGPKRRIRPRFLTVPLDVEHPFSITTLAGIITLTPGTVSANLSGDRRTLLVHALSEEDADGAVATIKERYERPILEIFGC